MRQRTVQRVGVVIALAIAVAIAAAADSAVPDARCAPDALAAGTVCLDRYEASVWRVPDPDTANASLVAKIRLGRADRGELGAAGATPLGGRGDDYAPCADDGQGCADLYAVSIPSVVPAAFITWFQAQQACTNSGKRLPTSAEWQVGANGTPDPGPDDGIADCNTAARGTPALTGERSRCTSARGASDAAGNLSEWVADWIPTSTTCTGWASFSDDLMCLAGANAIKGAPGALLRGGGFRDAAAAGPLAISGIFDPTRAEDSIGFRCARPLPEPGRYVQLGFAVTVVAALGRRRGSR
jgi:hypothetical protein